MTTDSPIPTPSSNPTTTPDHHHLLTRTLLIRLLTLLAMTMSYTLFHYTSLLFKIIQIPGFQASLLQQGAPSHILLSLFIITLLYALLVLAGVATGPLLGYDAGLLFASFGLLAVATQTGTLADTLHASPSKSIYLTLSLESLLLFSITAAAWLLLWKKFPAQLLANSPTPAATSHLVGHPIGAIMLQTLITAAAALLLIPTVAKGQTLAGIAIASLVGVCVVEYAAPNPKTARFYFLAPLIVALAGYLACYLADPSPTLIALGLPPSTLLTPLARPLPIDYASAAVAAALLGRWVGPHLRDGLQDLVHPPS